MRLDWTPEQLASVQASAWRHWISYGANVRRIFTAAWFEAQTTELAVVPKVEVVTPDEIIPPGSTYRGGTVTKSHAGTTATSESEERNKRKEMKHVQ